MNSYDKILEKPRVIEKVIALQTDLNKEQFFDYCLDVLRKTGFIAIEYSKQINKIKAVYSKTLRYGVINIEVREVYDILRLNLKVAAEENLFSKNLERFILNEFLYGLNTKYREI